MATLDIVFDGKSFPVAKRYVFALLEHRPELFAATSYVVQSSVPRDIFAIFHAALMNQSKLSVTQGNAAFLTLLADEFYFPELAAECAAFSDPISSLSDRVSQLERQVSGFSTRLRQTEIPMKELEPHSFERLWNFRILKDNWAKKLDGVISYLTKKHGGNVHENGIVTLTSKSISNDLKNVADVTSNSYFESQNEPGQWVVWDFRGMRVRLTHYTVWAQYLKAWVLEGSLDGSRWTEIDWQTNGVFKPYIGARKTQMPGGVPFHERSIAVANPGEFRFIRLTQTEKNNRGRSGTDELFLYAVEFFGTLSE
jgi:hypothetical protein